MLHFESENARKDIDVVLKAIYTEDYFWDTVNTTYERFLFDKRDQQPSESFDAYLTALKGMMKTYVSIAP